MSRLMAYLGNDPSLVSCAIHEVAAALAILEGDGRRGWGVGYEQESHILLRKKPSSNEDIDLVRLTADLRTKALLAHVTTHGDLGESTAATQPYRVKSWLFGHNGTLAQHLERDQVELPDFLLRNLKSQSRSELLFHRFLFHLREEGGRVDRPVMPEREAVEAMTRTLTDVALLDDEADVGSEGVVVVINGRRAVVGTRGVPAYVHRLEGVTTRPTKPLFAGHKPKPVRHDHYRGVIIVDRVLDEDLPFETLAADTVTVF